MFEDIFIVLIIFHIISRILELNLCSERRGKFEEKPETI